MSFGAGWSPSDLVMLIQTIYRVYDTIKNVPDEYQDLLDKFHDIEHELSVLEKRLTEVGKDRYGPFPGTVDLRNDLEEATKHLMQFEKLSRKGVVEKMVGTAKFSFDSRKTSRYSRKMDAHRTRLHDFRQDIILQATLTQLDTIRKITGTQVVLPDAVEVMSTKTGSCNGASTLSPDHASVLTQARRSVKLAKRLNSTPQDRSRYRLEAIPSESPNTESRGNKAVDDAVQNFVKQVVTQAEASKLYLQTTVPETRIEEFASIAEWFDKIQKVVGESPTIAASSGELQPSTLDATTPDVPRLPTLPAPNDNGLSTWFSSLSFHTAEDVSPVAGQSTVPTSDADLLSFSDIDDQSSATERTSLPEINSPARELLQFQSAVHICNPNTGSNGIKCDLEISRSEGSICILATAQGRFLAMPKDNNSGVISLTPGAHLGLPQVDRADAQAWKPLVLRHSVEPGPGCFPAILHPSIEIDEPENLLAPYQIRFYNAQFLDVEGKGGTAGRIDGYRYIFASKKDRDSMREILFGKTLLATAGYEESSASSCRIQPLSLWRSSDSETATVTVTLQGTSHKSKPPDSMLEFRILSCENLRKAAKQGQELILKARPVLQNPFDDEDDLTIRRQSVLSTSTATSISGSSTFMSRMSTRSKSFRSSSFSNELLRIKFSDMTDSEKADKKKFLKVLSEIFEPG